MEWMQVFTIIITIIAAVVFFYQITKSEIAVIREQINTMNNNHREDMQRMDAKWERLFERLLLKEQNFKAK